LRHGRHGRISADVGAVSYQKRPHYVGKGDENVA